MINDNFQLWKIKHQLAIQGSYQAIQQIQSHLHSQSLLPISGSQTDFQHLLSNSQIHFFSSGDNFGSYELYHQTPLFLVLHGDAEIRYINLEADTQTGAKVQGKGMLEIKEKELQEKYGKDNLNLLTNFELVAQTDCIVIETTQKEEGKKQLTQITQKELSIMKKLMIFPTKQISKVKVTPQTIVKDEVYLLSGKACYLWTSLQNKVILSCYTEGYLNLNQFDKKDEISLHIFDDSEIIELETDFLKDEYIKAVQRKRLNHLRQIIKIYKLMNQEEVQKMQEKIILKYRLPKKAVEAKISKKKIKEENINKSEQKLKSKTDLISTYSKIKCAIRIRKAKKID